MFTRNEKVKQKCSERLLQCLSSEVHSLLFIRWVGRDSNALQDYDAE